MVFADYKLKSDFIANFFMYITSVTQLLHKEVCTTSYPDMQDGVLSPEKGEIDLKPNVKDFTAQIFVKRKST